MSHFAKFKRAVAFLNQHCSDSNSFEDVAMRLIADRTNEFYDLDFIGYISDLDNTIQEGLSDVLSIPDPGFEGGE